MSELTFDPETGEVLEDAEVVAEFNDEPDADAPSDDEAVPVDPDQPDVAVEYTGPSDEAIIKLGKKFDTYAKAVLETYGDEAQALYPCPLCPDNHKGFVDLRAAGQVPGEIASEVHSFLTGSAVGTFEQDPATNTCPVCKGKTRVMTGAVAGEYITRTCTNCKGYGFMPPPGSTPESALIAGPNGNVPDAAEHFVSEGDVDEWGEPRLLPDGTVNSNFGMMPNRKTIHPVYGVTANLTQRVGE